MKNTYYIFTLLLLVSSLSVAQNKKTKKADKHYDRLEYVEAVEDYEKLVKKGNADAYVYQRLADSYYNISNTKKAETYYKLYLAEDPDANEDTYFRYAEMLKANGNYNESNKVMNNFASRYPRDTRAKEFKNNPNYLDQIRNEKTMYTVNALGTLNAENSDFGAYEKDGKVYFVSARNKSRRNYAWNDQPTLDVYMANKVADDFDEPTLIEGDVNSKYHEGTIAISPDGNTMYFTRNDYTDGDYEESSDGIGQLKLYKSSLINDKWDDVQELSFNDSEYSTGHPALSQDGRTLYFSSDMPGGFGMSDLYKVAINEDGSFGEPKNLGAHINTKGRDSFPFIDDEGTLYFSSDGHLGLGGLDVFYIDAGNISLEDVKNMGQPVNSKGDDFAYSYNKTNKAGYLSSNRGSEDMLVPNDDIYRVGVIEIKELDLIVKVIDSETGDLIEGADVTIYNENQIQAASKLTNEDATAEFMLSGEKNFTIQINADEYESNSASVSENDGEKVSLVVELDPIEKMITPEEVVLNPIYFEFDKSNITPEGAMELDRLVAVMKKHETMEIFVKAHTDSRGANSYNLNLSEMRAQSTVKYVVLKGIDAARISGEGFGENEPKIKCGSNCSEEQHQENRRSEFKITKK